MTEILIRPADPNDLDFITASLRTFARELGEADHFTAMREGVAEALFGYKAVANCAISEIDGVSSGFVTWTMAFDSFAGAPGVFVEDLYVAPEARRSGLARALFSYVARQAIDQGCTRMEARIQTWNPPIVAAMKSMGFTPFHEWLVVQQSGDGLRQLAGPGPLSDPPDDPNEAWGPTLSQIP